MDQSNDISSRIAHLSPQKREMLLRRLLDRQATQRAKIRVLDRTSAVFPLSLAQRRLWFFEQLAPGTAVYNACVAFRMQGMLSLTALEQALVKLIQRHETLRTLFRVIDNQPAQVITPSSQACRPDASVITLTDIQHTPDADRESLALRLATQEAQTPINIESGPILRVRLIRLTQEDHILLMVMHHLVSDAWSVGVLLRELGVLYSAWVEGKPDDLPPLPIQYVDFAQWQRQEELSSHTLQSQLAYWKDRLGGTLPVLELPTDHLRPKVQTHKGDCYPVSLSPALTETLKSLSQREGVTLFMTLLAAFNVLLYRYTGQEDILLGIPVAGRAQPEVQGLVGCFINTLVLRTNLAGRPSFGEVLQQVRQATLGAYTHQNVPFEQLVQELHPNRNLSHSPLFQVMFNYMDAPSPSVQFAGLTGQPLNIHTGGAQFDLSVYLFKKPDDISGFLEYNTDLFDRMTVNGMLESYRTVLEAISLDLSQSIADLPVLSETQRRQCLTEWNQTAAAYPHDVGVHQLFEAQVKRRPQATAAMFCPAGGEDVPILTYEALNQRANQLGHYLRRLGVSPGTLVGIYMDRSLEMLVALLGTLKAGGAYLPLDPSFPTDRLAFMLADSQASMVLTQQSVAGNLPPHHAQVVCLDRDWELMAGQSQADLDWPGEAKHLAYLIYTSGSTGRPKGVQVSHGSLVNFLTSMQRQPGLLESDTLLAVTTLAFDIAGLELYLPLTVGARLAIAARKVASDGVQLIEALDRYAVTVMQATPATWQLMLMAGWRGSPRLKILCGGEAVSRDMANQLADRNAAVWNMYGPTETTVWSSVSRITHGVGPVLIGRPIANTQFYVLDAHQHMLPIGVPGELCIGGAGLARGYLNAPDLTAEKFRPDPYGSQLGARLYRSGDLVRYRADGEIEFLGRSDYQVKVRGFRIELGEIEAALEAHPAIQQSVVVAREGVPGDKRLAAYIVIRPGPPPSISKLRDFLRSRLPEYMLPSAVILLESLPLTPNGKVDRRALPTPDSGPRLAAAFTPPQTETERAVAALWQNVFKLERVGIHDNFFDLGGHSLMVTQLLFQARDVLHVDIPVSFFFGAPTVADMARLVDDMRSSQVEPAASEYQAAPDTHELFPQLDWQAEAALEMSICAGSARPALPPDECAHVFLTGASGFVGAFLLQELLARTNANIYCLVRGEDLQAGIAKLRRNLAALTLDDDLSQRVIPVWGDLSRPLLGLGDDQFYALADTIDVIYHSGAVTQFMYRYAEVKPANVGGTHEILRLAACSRLKPVHHISTMSVFSDLDVVPGRLVGEDDWPEHPEAHNIGYVQSKWVAERLVMAARERGIPVSMYRLGRISGHSQTGACRADDFMWLWLKACVEIGCAPAFTSHLDMTPVDYISRAVVHLARQSASLGQTFHFFNSTPPSLDQVINGLRAFGYPIETVSYSRWQDSLGATAAHSPQSAASRLVGLLPPSESDRDPASLWNILPFDDRYTRDSLAGSSITRAPLDERLLNLYLSYFVRIGFLNSP